MEKYILFMAKYVSEMLCFDKEILSHGKRVADYAVALASNCPLLFEEQRKNDPMEIFQALYDGGCIHDAGKIMYSRKLLYKKEGLTRCEKKVIEQHPLRTVEMLDGVNDFLKRSETYRRIVKNACLYHHERWDGTGYPYGLSQKAIPPEAQIMKIADILDALTSHRPYKPLWNFEEAIEYIQSSLRGSGYTDLMKAFEKSLGKLRTIFEGHSNREGLIHNSKVAIDG